MFLCLFSIALCQEHMDTDPNLLARPLVIEFPESRIRNMSDDIEIQCTSWRVAVEANNLGSWKTIPKECADYVKDYMLGRSYNIDLETVSKEAGNYAKSLELKEDGMDAWVFDIDETLISNLPYYSDHGYGYHFNKSLLCFLVHKLLFFPLSRFLICNFQEGLKSALFSYLFGSLLKQDGEIVNLLI